MNKRRIPEILIVLVLGLVVVIATQQYLRRQQVVEEEVIIPYIPKIEYGINTDSLIVYKNDVLPKQFLSDILLSYRINYNIIDLMVKKSENVFNVTKIRPGDVYTVICANDSNETVQYFIYETSATSYIIFDLRDSVHVEAIEREVKRQIKTTSGRINTSLWNALAQKGTNPNLALELSEIYAWAIDFFGLQKGDEFRMIYEELSVEGKVIGMGKILAALFHHSRKDFYAFYFIQDSIGDYFDENAQSLRRAFLKAPLRFSRISSRYSHSRLHPILKIRRPHHGVDYAAAYGTPVQAIGDGKVIKVTFNKGAGNMVTIRHNGMYSTSYLHLSKFGKGIRTGAFVKQGDIIGYVGSSGLSTGPHLDFRFYKNGVAIDPTKVESPPAEPVESKYLDNFKILADSLTKQLEGIRISKEC